MRRIRIGTLREWYRVLRPGGMLLAVVPDHRFKFDRYRSVTSFAHMSKTLRRSVERAI